MQCPAVGDGQSQGSCCGHLDGESISLWWHHSECPPFAVTSGPICSYFLLRLKKRDRQSIHRKTTAMHLSPPAVPHLSTAGPNIWATG